MAVKFTLEPSYYPEDNRKKIINRLFDNILWTLKYQRANRFYTLYGMDRSVKRNGHLRGYIDERSFWKGLS
jgi:hypothetical protein